MSKSKKVSHKSKGSNINASYDVSYYPNMKVLYQQYCESIDLLTARIQELNEVLKLLN